MTNWVQFKGFILRDLQKGETLGISPNMDEKSLWGFLLPTHTVKVTHLLDLLTKSFFIMYLYNRNTNFSSLGEFTGPSDINAYNVHKSEVWQHPPTSWFKWNTSASRVEKKQTTTIIYMCRGSVVIFCLPLVKRLMIIMFWWRKLTSFGKLLSTPFRSRWRKL